jgi:integrase
VLILVLGLRKDELLGLTWDRADLDGGELDVSRQFQRVRGQLHHLETKTPASDTVLPLPNICVAALKGRQRSQEEARKRAGDTRVESGFVFDNGARNALRAAELQSSVRHEMRPRRGP